MKVSLNWLNQFTDIDIPLEQLVDTIGAQLGAVEEVVNLGERYQGIVVAKVVECSKLENTDHLNLCKIDDGGKVRDVERDSNGWVQVICGAPNVRTGILAAWLPPGTTVPASWDDDKFVLEAREIRGHKSNGMLASAKELALNDDHAGILEIDKAAQPGDSFAATYKLDDYIIDIENKMFTHRPDCFGALGVAREIAGISHRAFTSPDWYQSDHELPTKEEPALPLEISNELPELVPRFSAITVSNITVKPSPLWLQVALHKVGQKPINNIVDLTNFYMLLTGQPLHAYDYDKVKAVSSAQGAKFVVRYPHKGEKIALLNGKTIEPRQEAIMIATDQAVIGLGGVMGGEETEVDEKTKNIIIESANFDMYSIRKTSMAHGLFTDAVTRFTKGQSPLQTVAVLTKIVNDIETMAGGTVAGPLIDLNAVEGRQWVHPPVPVEARFINERLGLQLSATEMKQLLDNVEFSVTLDGDKLTVTAPFWRTDIEMREDVVEEIGRLYGYDKLPLVLPHRDLKPAQQDALLKLKQRLRTRLRAAGANEVLTYSFVHGNLLEKVGQDKELAFRLSNALSPDLQYYRLSLIPSLLEKVHPNIKAGYSRFVMFEIGKSHSKDLLNKNDALPIEEQRLALVFAADTKTAKADYIGAPYYQVRLYLTDLLVGLGIEPVFHPAASYEPDMAVSKAAIAPFDKSRSSLVKTSNGEFIGEIGEFTAATRRNLKLPSYSAGFELDVSQLLKLQSKRALYRPLSRFPKVEQDITLKVPRDTQYGDMALFLDELFTSGAMKTDIHGHTISWFTPLSIYQGDDADHKNISWRFTIASYERTLTDQEVNALLDAVASHARNKFGAERL